MVPSRSNLRNFRPSSTVLSHVIIPETGATDFFVARFFFGYVLDFHGMKAGVTDDLR
jgi:hypothetical protein